MEYICIENNQYGLPQGLAGPNAEVGRTKVLRYVPPSPARHALYPALVAQVFRPAVVSG